MPSDLPSITGKQLVRLLMADGWTYHRRVTHGLALTKRFPDGRMRRTVVSDKNDPLPAGTLAAILGPLQTGIGRAGLADLIAVHGFH